MLSCARKRRQQSIEKQWRPKRPARRVSTFSDLSSKALHTQGLRYMAAFQLRDTNNSKDPSSPAGKKLDNGSAFRVHHCTSFANNLIHSAHLRQAQCQSQPGLQSHPQRRTHPFLNPQARHPSTNTHPSRSIPRKPAKSASQQHSTAPRRFSSPAHPNTLANPFPMKPGSTTTKSSLTLSIRKAR